MSHTSVDVSPGDSPRSESSAISRDSRAFRGALYLGTIAVIVGMYSYPALRTVSTVGFRRLPPIAAQDLGLYLNLSRLSHDSQGTVLDPYYHVTVPANSVGFLKFRLAPQLYGLVVRILGGRMWMALFVWNLFWWSSLCVVAMWLFRGPFPRAPMELALCGVFALMCLEIATLPRLLVALAHIPSVSAFASLQLPYIRPFFPQIAVPLLLCYVGLQIIAMGKSKAWAWGLMAVLQFFALASFPYATMMMAGTTAIAGCWYVYAHRRESSWRLLAGYGLVCAAVDLAFLAHGTSGIRTGSPGQSSLIHLQLELLPLMIGKLWVLLGILATVAAFARNARSELKWTLVGLGVTNMLLLLGDAVIPETTIMLSDHAGYFTHATIVMLLIYTIAAYSESFQRAHVILRIGSIVVTGVCIAGGLFLAEETYRRNLRNNQEQADMGWWLAQGAVAGTDLVISDYDACAWVPLLSSAEVLYCRTAQCLLTPERNQQVHRRREVLYLYFQGRDREWIETTNELGKYGFYYEQFVKEKPSQRDTAVRSEIATLFSRVEQGEPATREFFRGFRRIWVVQRAEKPIFADARLDAYFEIGKRERVGSLTIEQATAK